MRIVFFGTSNVALPILEALNKEQEVLAVVTMPDAKVGRTRALTESPVSVLANEMKLKVLKPANVKSNPEFHHSLQNISAELFVVVSYGQILPLDIINLPKYKSINVHFSALPKYRGPSPIQFALLNGDEYTGISVFILDEQIDHGPLLFQEIVKIEPDDNYISLTEKLAHKSAGIINQILADYASGKVTPLPQDETTATYSKIITKDDGKVDWNRTSTQIYNQFRAFYPWPGVWTTWDGKMVKIINCMATNLQMISESTNVYKLGTVLDGGVVACGKNTYLQIKTLQLEGKKETSISDFLNGYKEFVGAKLL